MPSVATKPKPKPPPPRGHRVACHTEQTRANDLGNWDVICAASQAGHLCHLDHDDLNHWDGPWDEATDGPWLLGVTHECACNPPHTWPEVR